MTVELLSPDDFAWASGTGGAGDVRRIVAAATTTDGRSPLDEAALLTLRHHGLETSIVLLARADDGDAQGFAYVHGLSGTGRPQLDLVVAPAVRRRGVGSMLLRAALDTAGGIPVTAWSHGNHPGAATLAATFGFRQSRELWLMRRTGGEVAEVPPPRGYAIRPFATGDEDGFLAVNARAFADHPEQGSLDRVGLAERMAEEWYDPFGFLVAEHRADSRRRIAGFHWTKAHAPAHGAPYGEVYVIGVDPSAQGTGLGRALLAAGLNHLQSRGLAETVLYVEAVNRGAIALYGSVGFRHDPRDTDVMYTLS